MTKKTEPDKKETVFKAVTGLESAHKNINNTLQRQFLRRLGVLGFIFLLIISGGAYLLWPNASPEKGEKRLSQQDQPIKKGALLPVVSPRPMDVYAQAFTPVPPGNAAISFIILGTGQFPDLTQQAINVLPKEITFAISPLIPQAKEWVEKARLKQHEVILNLGLQPDNYPSNDPGPHTLLTHLHKDENLRRFNWALQQVPMVVGVVHETGNFFTTQDESLRPLIQEIRRSGLFFLDTLVSPYSLVSKISKEEESPYAAIHFFCGENPFVIEKELQNLENLARQKGHVIVVASLSPTLLKNLTSWSATLKNKNISLLPMTALFKLKILIDTTGPDAKKLVLKEFPYRQGVGIMLLNTQKKVFVGQRINDASPAWQMPQGGIDAGETPLQAACRELTEEIGTKAFVVWAESSEWYSYDFPPEHKAHFWHGQYRGQKQKWFLFHFTGEDKDICLETEHPEFSDWKWVSKDDLIHFIVPFKRDLYKAVIDDLWKKV